MRTPDPAVTTYLPKSARELDLRVLADAMATLSQRLQEADGPAALEELVEITVDQIPRADWASITYLRNGHFSTQAATDPRAFKADLMQYQMQVGPCVDAVYEDGAYVTGDAAGDPRWQQWGQRVNAEVGVCSVMAQRLHLHDDFGVLAALNIYSQRREAFDFAAISNGLVLATHGALLVTAMQAQDQAANLRVALESNREIGIAIGVLMTQHHLTRVQAFDLLRAASQNTNRKLVAIAADVADTGTLILTLPTPAPAPRSPSPTRPS